MISDSRAKRKKATGLDFRSLFLHAWDLEDEGVDKVLDWMRAAGLNTVCLASTYHHGWFVHPHHTGHRAFMTEGDVCYFRPRKRYYQQTRLRLKPSRLCGEKDWFDEVGKRLGPDMRLVAWTIGAHNTSLGLEFPKLTQRNVYGDSLPHALCPANRDVREYLKAIVRDLAAHYPLWGVQLEAFGWMGFSHGHHHERDLVGLSPLEQELMGLCVCAACSSQAGLAGVEMNQVKQAIKQTLDDAFREAPNRPKNHPADLAELGAAHPELEKFLSWRTVFFQLFVAEIKKSSLKGTNCRLLLQTGFDPSLKGLVDGFGCGAYQKNAAETAKICRDARKNIPTEWNGLLQCFIQLGMGVPKSETQLRQIIEAVRKQGCNGINFYNRSESPPKMLAWLAKIMPTFK